MMLIFRVRSQYQIYALNQNHVVTGVAETQVYIASTETKV